MNTEEQLLDLQDQNEARVAKLNDMHVELQLLRSTLPREATALAPSAVEAEGLPASEPPPPGEAWALDALHRGLLAEAATVRGRQAALVQRSVHDLEHHRKGDSEALLAQEVASTLRQFDEATAHLQSLVHAEDAAAARMRDVALEHRKIGAALGDLEREVAATPADEAADFKRGLRAHLSALLDTFFPHSSQAAAARDEGGGKRARGSVRGPMEALVFALLDEWPNALDLGAPPCEAYAAEDTDLLVRCGVAERDPETPARLRLVNFNE